MLFKSLVDYGLSEKEAQVYLALLEVGEGSISQLAEKTSLNRSSVYQVLDTLEEKALVAVSETPNVQKFVAASPEVLLSNLERHTQDLEKKIQKSERIIPYLKEKQVTKNTKPRVRVYDGALGLISAMNETLMTEERLLRSFTSGENLLKFIPDYMLEWSQTRMDRGITIRTIFVDNEESKLIEQMSPSMAENVFVPKDNYPFPVDSMIWDNKVGYLITEKEKLTSIIIEGKEIATVTKNMFDMAFKRARATGGEYLEKY